MVKRLSRDFLMVKVTFRNSRKRKIKMLRHIFQKTTLRTKPSYITIEDLNVRGMMKNRHLSKAIAGQCFNQFKVKLGNKCKQYGIELRIVDRFYPSSKLCSQCGILKKELKLSGRIFECECGFVEDRDKNASINLANAKIYKIAT